MEEEEHLCGAPGDGFVAADLGGGEVVDGGAVAVDASAAADGDVFDVMGDDEMCAGDGFGFVDVVVGREVVGVIVFAVGAAEDDGAGFEIETAVGAEVDGAGEVGAGGEGDDAAGIEGGLDGLGVEGLAVADGAEIADVAHKGAPVLGDYV